MLFQGSSVGQEVYYLKQSIVIGIPAGLTISLIWWNPESPKHMMIIAPRHSHPSRIELD
jgi:hypothetical protein